MDKVHWSPSYETRSTTRRRVISALGLVFLLGLYLQYQSTTGLLFTSRIPAHASTTVARCLALDQKPGPPTNFYKRSESDRYAPGTPPVLIKNARIWTGGENGTEVLRGEILLEKGLIKEVGRVSSRSLARLKEELVVYDARDRWVTPGIVDLHSHLGDASSPELEGAVDDNSLKGTVQPWLRALDGLNTHDDSYALSIAGGVTTSLVLPGSANAIGGQGFTIKLRRTKERSPTSMLLEPPYQIDGSPQTGPPRWRQMKHACGENPSAVYSVTRMDTVWAFREAYNKAKQVKQTQDAYCSKALAGAWEGLGDFPEDLQWEALVDVLRGKVKVQTHCYEAVDLDDIVRLSNEFQFPIAAFHHASEAYLVPDLIKKAYDHPPAVAIFATNARYKREAYRSSEFAARILAENGLKVVMKSDHPVLNSRYLLYEAQQAFYYGLPENLALASVTSTPAGVMGMDHRIGYLKGGWDADVVMWDSHPLALGATPAQVFIDGIAQLEQPYTFSKPDNFQKVPKVPNFDKQAADAVKFDGLPPLEPKKADSDYVLFTNVRSVFTSDAEGVRESFSANEVSENGVVLVDKGRVVCSGSRTTCAEFALVDEVNVQMVDLKNGTVIPGLVSFGSPLGLEHIDQEDSTNDGWVFDPLAGAMPKILGSDGGITRAVDGLQFASRDALLAYRAGVTKAITAPSHGGFFSGLSVSFSLGAMHKLETGAIVQDAAAVHVSVRHFGGVPSVSTQIAALRHLLLDPPQGDVGRWFKKAAEGTVPLVVEAHNADIIATLIMLKDEIEEARGTTMKLTITGAEEAHLLAAEIAKAKVGVVLNPSRPFPAVWESRRILPGPPLSEQSAISLLLSHNVTVGIGIQEKWSARNLFFDIAWAALEAGGRISEVQALSLSSNLEKLLGGEVEVTGPTELVAIEGGSVFDMTSKVVAVISPRLQLVHLF
ncbi:hypothetical protein JAAARDRAFT_35246 [Jaapia argillacea MUCL 33604]|uniref:Amidohydrolase-related domain-containing protein n=1 Tax=Jaapia argillacea MUCL 33604 TaxID=933084 RepID=A0A067Q224_9AGAM|nr:hypothetical protein JAAARDRAFT_35246 [Jaapia argillacea MUCL 33604]